VSHWENNYSGAVKRLNAITAQLATLDFGTTPVFVLNGLKREELIAGNSMILHELYFDGLGAESEADRALRDALVRDFGSVERWRAEFVAMGKAIGGGAGWVLLTYSSRDRKLVNQWAADHTHGLAGGRPILASTCTSTRIISRTVPPGEVRRRVHGEHSLESRLATAPSSTRARQGDTGHAIRDVEGRKRFSFARADHRRWPCARRRS
jgi:Iron/manganese superoxide dismutases, C-terminal domain